MVQNGAPQTTARVHVKKPPLRYYHGVLVIAFLYLALLTVPWALTCLLARSPRWTKIESRYITDDDYLARITKFKATFDAVRFLDGLAAVACLPVLTYLLARAAVVFSQRCRPKQSLNARQLFALADSRFCQSAIIDGDRTSVAIYGAVLLVLGNYIPPREENGRPAHPFQLASLSRSSLYS